MPQPLTIIERSRGWVSLDLAAIWEFRELLYFLCWRDIKIRYTQTVLGALWAILQPTLTMVVFSIFFGRLAGMEDRADGLPYPLFVFTALVPWGLFSTGLSHASDSLVGNSNLLTKVYFPRLIIPASAVLSGIIDFLISLVILSALLVGHGRWPTLNVLWLPLLVLLTLLCALGVSLWLSALNVQFRDVRYTIPFLTQLWLLATPIAYPSSLIQTESLRLLYGLNPMSGVVEGFRWALLDAQTEPGPMVALSALISLALLLSGAFYFRRMERTFADVV